MKFHLTTKVLARQAIIAAVYVVLTMSGFGVSYGPVQFRFSEIMTWLAFFDPKNIIGLTLGCFIANIGSPFGVVDMIFGTLGTLFATLGMAKSQSKWLAMIWPAVFSFLYSGEALFLGQITSDLFLVVTAQIMLSEFIIVAIIGIPVMMLLTKSEAVRHAFTDIEMEPTHQTWTGADAFPF